MIGRILFAAVIAAAIILLVGVATKSVVATFLGMWVGAAVGAQLVKILFPENRRG